MAFFLKLGLFTLLCWTDGAALAASSFNTDFIQGKFDKSSIDDTLNAGVNGQVIYAVSLNGRGQGNFYFTRENGRLMFDESFLQKIAPMLNAQAARELRAAGGLSSGSKKYSFTEDSQTATLNLWYGDAFMGREVDHFADMELSPSINSTTLSYSLGGSYYKNINAGTSEESIPFTGHLRSIFSENIFNLDVSSADVAEDSLNIDNINVARLFPEFKSKVTVGETYTSTRYGENFSFTGAQIGYVANLNARRDRFYTPNIQGFAATNATVEVYQDSRLLFSKAVAAGNFVLDEVVGLSNQTLRVVVKEANGQVRTFYYDNSVIPGLITPGSIDYQVSVGRYRFSEHEYGDNFISGEYSYGTDVVTPSINSIVAESYQNLTFGAAFPLQQFGAVGVSMANSRYTHDGKTDAGQSYSVNYSKYLNNGIDIQLAGYRYATQDYFDFSDAMDDKFSENDFLGNLRSRYSASVAGRDPFTDNQVTLNYLKEQYWGGSHSQSTYSLSYGGFMRWMNYTVSLARSYDEDTGDADNSLSVSLNIPIGSDYSSSVYSRYTNFDSKAGHSETAEVGLNGYTGNNSYNVGVTHSGSGNGETLSGGLNHTGEHVSSQLYGNTSPDYRSFNGSVSGSLMLAQGEVLASRQQSQTYAVAKVEGVKDARVNGIKTQDNGYAVVPLNDQYDPQDVLLDVSSLSNNVVADSTVVNLRPRSGSVTLVKFTTKSVKYFNAVLKDQNGERLGFGTEIQSGEGERYLTGNNGRLFVRMKLADDSDLGSLRLKAANGCSYAVDLSVIKSQLDEDYIDLGTLKCQLNAMP